jgi:hypothetical protein
MQTVRCENVCSCLVKFCQTHYKNCVLCDILPRSKINSPLSTYPSPHHQLSLTPSSNHPAQHSLLKRSQSQRLMIDLWLAATSVSTRFPCMPSLWPLSLSQLSLIVISAVVVWQYSKRWVTFLFHFGLPIAAAGLYISSMSRFESPELLAAWLWWMGATGDTFVLSFRDSSEWQ